MAEKTFRVQETATPHDVVTIRLVPTIALDYQARAVFPDARLPARPGRVPAPADIRISRRLAEFMLVDALTRPDQLRVERRGDFKGGAVGAWRTLVKDLGWALLPAKEQEARSEAAKAAREADDRSYDWFQRIVERTNPVDVFRSMVNDLRFRDIAQTEEFLGRMLACSRKNAAFLKMAEIADEVLESKLEKTLDAESWRTAGKTLRHIAQRQP